MKVRIKKALSFLLVMVMIFTAIPFLKLESKAAVANYSSTAAVEYANRHVYNYNSLWSNYNYDGGDCANFVSQCLYAGGMNMTSTWHSYDSPNSRNILNMSSYTWVRANELCNYLTSLGGTRITAPNASNISVGDCLFYDWTGNGVMNHSAIVTSVSNGQIKIACHSPASSRDGSTTNWTLGASPSNIRLVKLYGNLCTANNRPDYDGYRVNNYSWVSGGTVSPGWYIHVTETKVTNGITYGRFNFKGTDSWIPLTSCSYSYHVDSIKVSHIFGRWYNIGIPSCVKGYKQQHICARCSYIETRDVAPTGHTPGAAATCTKAQICTKCGEVLNPALGHDFGDWSVSKEATCTEDGIKVHTCKRCSIKDEQVIDAIGHNYAVQTDAQPNCTDNGWMRLRCLNCADEYAIENLDTDGWSNWTTAKNNNVPAEKTQSKTQYRHKDKSTTTSDDSVLSGWTLYDTTTSYGNWSGWSEWIEKWEAETDVKQRESNTVYGYYYYYCTNCKKASPYWNISCTNCGTYIPEHSNCFKWSDISYSSAGLQTWNYEKSYTTVFGGIWFKWVDPGGAPNVINGHRYRTRSKTTTYHFYKWSSWSAWSDTAVSANANRQVETQTVYRYKLSALGHDFQDSGKIKVVDLDPNTEGLQYDLSADICAYKINECSRCHIEKAQDEGDIITHNWGEPTTPYEDDKNTPNIDESKILVYTCANGHVKEVLPDPNPIPNPDPHKHNYVKTSQTAPTCTLDGEEVWSCTCGDSYIVTINALGHDTTDKSLWYVSKDATCTTAGILVQPCIRHADCDYEDEIDIPPRDHDYVVKETLPTCTEDGEIITTCSRCDYYNRVVTPMHEHEMGEWKVIVEPTCSPGIERRYCLHTEEFTDDVSEEWCDCCTYSEDREIPPIYPDHVFEHHINAPWCEIAGLEWDECIYCHLIKDEEVIPPLEHDDVEIEHKDPTCTECGLSIVQCRRCMRILSNPTDPLGHELDNGERIGKTCIGGEVILYSCLREGCDYTYIDSGEGGTHNLGEWVTKSNPTCAKPGEKVCQCQNMVLDNGEEYQCLYTETDYIPALGHDYLKTNETTATCLTAKTEEYTCQRENCADVVIIPVGTPLGHDESGDYAITKKASCTEDGEKQKCCPRVNNGEVCGAVLDTVVIPMRSHNMGEFSEIVKATCTEAGEEACSCLNYGETDEYTACDYSESRKIPALGHDFGEWYVVRKSTYTVKGEERCDCSRCEVYKTRDLPLLDNDQADDSDEWDFLTAIIEFFISLFEDVFGVSC